MNRIVVNDFIHPHGDDGPPTKRQRLVDHDSDDEVKDDYEVDDYDYDYDDTKEEEKDKQGCHFQYTCNQVIQPSKKKTRTLMIKSNKTPFCRFL